MLRAERVKIDIAMCDGVPGLAAPDPALATVVCCLHQQVVGTERESRESRIIYRDM